MDDVSAESASLRRDMSSPALTPPNEDCASTTHGFDHSVQQDGSTFTQQLNNLIVASQALSDNPEAPSVVQDHNASTDSTSEAVTTLEQNPNPEPSPAQPHSCTSSACAALTVFSTPELLASVLGFLDLSDVMLMRRTNRTWARAVKDSPELRICVFLRPQWRRPPADYMLLDLKMPGLSIQRAEPVDKGQWVVITINASAAQEIAPRRGSSTLYSRLVTQVRSRSLDGDVVHESADEARNSKVKYDELHITQPPLLGLQALMVDSDGSDASSAESSFLPERWDDADNDEEPQMLAPCAKMSCDAGINLEFVAETALALLNRHRAASDDDGRQVVFKAIVSFCEPPPQLRERGTTRSVIRLC